MTTESIQTTLNSLQAERETLQTAISELSAQRSDLNANLDALLADAERKGTPAATQAATDAETAISELDNQLRRKRAALAACEDELRQAVTDLATAKRGAVLVELQNVHREYEQCAFVLDADIGDLDAWRRLAELARKGNQLYTQVQSKGELGRLFVQPHEVRGKLLAALGARIDSACGMARGGDGTLTPTIAFECERTGGRIQHL